MHPSKDILGTKGFELKGKRIALCITGSVAAVKCPELARELMRHGAEVRACMSPQATELITPELMHWATGNEVVVKLTGRLEHVELAEWADLILVAPATANTISKIYSAIDDTTVTSVVSVALGLKKPVVVVPAMHASMFAHELLQQNLARLRSVGVQVLGPRIEEGRAKIAEVAEIVQFVIGALGPRDLFGRRVLVTAGPTFEPIDPVKVIANRSSGKMGLAVARAAAARGADVVLIYGPGTEVPPAGVRVIRVETTQEMRDAFIRELELQPDIVVSAAAPQDFVVESPSGRKLRHTEPVTLRLVPAPRVLSGVRERSPHSFVVGFKTEHNVSDEELLRAAEAKLSEGLDLVVANDVGRPGAGFGTDTNEVLIVTKSGWRKMKATKVEIAGVILDLAIAKS
ncbi:MAG: bifunctional phosphopantothenoylcysteine decarboxylase/phosphopantothenate--cysteine ligase CoaBC [Candidatus Hadarchaeum sp.]|uniref:bifunctional phosphopantothenoylcysteine decarboxylase/phosphopantothenate--cysteine ligase CoaBC n=1 Tax=Candidatus Hadarchaeum sp. TaxID=2883567 RepID=UPI003D0ECA6A